MHCQRCGYLLFNLPRSQCPECGTSFDLGRYRFVAGAVSFHCPHCDQAYYGNDDRGLPWPRDFECVQCRRRLSLQELRVVPEAPDARGWAGSSWDDREQLGFWRAWWQTTKTLLLRPSTFYRSHVGTSNSEAVIYSIVSSYAGLAPLMLFQALITIVALTLAASTANPPPMPPLWIFAIVFSVLAVVVPPFAPLLGGAVTTLTVHLAVLVLAPKRKSIGYTFRTVLYSYGTNAILAVPICGAYAGGIWQIVTLVVGVREVHETSTGRAVLAVLWPIVVIVPLYLAAVLSMVFMVGQ